MRIGGHNFKGETNADGVVDWINLPGGANTISLWDCLHDAHVVSIRSDLLDRTMVLHCEIKHLVSFYHLDDELTFALNFEGVQSARVLRYAIWPGEFNTPKGISREEESALVAEYQAKWREESLSWNDFERSITRQGEQVFDISEAILATSPEDGIALRICGQLNYAVYHEVYLRAAGLEVTRSDGQQIGLDQFQKLGERYWEAFSQRNQ